MPYIGSSLGDMKHRKLGLLFFFRAASRCPEAPQVALGFSDGTLHFGAMEPSEAQKLQRLMDLAHTSFGPPNGSF